MSIANGIFHLTTHIFVLVAGVVQLLMYILCAFIVKYYYIEKNNVFVTISLYIIDGVNIIFIINVFTIFDLGFATWNLGVIYELLLGNFNS